MNLKPVALGLVLAACSTAQAPSPAWTTAVNSEDPRYPHARFITGVGLSSTAADDADARAKENVALQISTRLESETSSFQKYTTQAGTSETVTSRLSVRSSFDRAELIRLVDRARQGGVFYSYAVLDRAATDRELGASMSADLSSFHAAAGTARKARAEEDAGVFGTAAAEAAKIRPRIDSAFIVRRAVAGHPAAEEREYVVLRNQLLALIEEARARRVVGVVVKSAGNAVKRLGLRPDAAGCATRDRKDLTDATELDVTPEEKCSEGALGERCEVVVRLVAQACSGGVSGVATVAAARGIHPSDRERARRLAWDKVTAQAVEAAVRDALKGTILIGE